MPTRRLIAVALLCGMAILVAGAIQLFTIEPTHVEPPGPGASARVGDVEAIVVSATRVEGVLAVRVVVTTGEDALETPGRRWNVVATGVSGAGDDCGATVPARSRRECTVRFAGVEASDSVVVTFRVGDEQAEWALPA